MTDKFKREDPNEIICPYCDYSQGDMWEVKETEGLEKCPECDKMFKWERHTEVEYRTECNCEDNNEEHEFYECGSWIEDEKESNQEFQICHCIKCSEYKANKRDKRK